MVLELDFLPSSSTNCFDLKNDVISFAFKLADEVFLLSACIVQATIYLLQITFRSVIAFLFLLSS